MTSMLESCVLHDIVDAPKLTSNNSTKPKSKGQKRRTAKPVAPSDRVTRNQGKVRPFQGEIVEHGPGITSRLRERASKIRRLRLTVRHPDPWMRIKRINCRYKDPKTGCTRWHKEPGLTLTMCRKCAAREPRFQ
ncbi:MAG: hypothetical protein Q9202_001419 [Teloschistes flavicans]